MIQKYVMVGKIIFNLNQLKNSILFLHIMKKMQSYI
jgi:hypothetical protein